MLEGKEKNVGNILLIWVYPKYQGNGIRVRHFIKVLARILFFADLEVLTGKASPPDGKDLRQARAGKPRDWRMSKTKSGKTRLFEFYLRCGFESDGDEDWLYMTKESSSLVNMARQAQKGT